MISQAIGGIGLFLLGMFLLTEALHSLSGRALRHAISRFTRTPLSGVMTGALTTAVVQSSSATTFAVLGLASAGMIVFEQALSVVIGANIGTTVTGWLVVLFGFKLKFEIVTLPLVTLGVLLRLFTRGRWRHIGMALAGFGLLFVGIELLSEGMAQLEGVLTPETFPPDSLESRVWLIVLGVALTAITQSSSVGVAMALAALHAGRINFTQAACLVIGFDIGTTVKAVFGAMGASLAAKRTAASHVIFNIFTAAGAFALLPLYVLVAEKAFGADPAADGEWHLVAFHTAFNLLSVIAILPFIGAFAKLIERILPEHGREPVRLLDKALRHRPDEALRAAHHALRETARALFTAVEARLDESRPKHETLRELDAIELWIEQIEDYLGAIGSAQHEPSYVARHVAAMHMADHLERLTAHAHNEDLCEPMRHEAELKESVELAGQALGKTLAWLKGEAAAPSLDELRTCSEKSTEYRRSARPRILTSTAKAALDAGRAEQVLDTLHWLDRVTYHIWRFAVHAASDTNNHDPPARAQ